MSLMNYQEAIERIMLRDQRYDAAAYIFLRQALDFAVKRLEKPLTGPARHVSGQELIEGIREYALQEYGPMALRVLNHWGLRQTEDFGELVFNLVDEGVLGRTEEDSRKDFASGYDFENAFRRPFLPKIGGKPDEGASRESR